MDKFVDQDKLLNAGGTKKKATALLAGHGISRPAVKPKNNKKGKQKKRCATKDCKNIVKVHFHKFCDDCYSSRKEKSSAENESMMCPPLRASKIIHVSYVSQKENGSDEHRQEQTKA